MTAAGTSATDILHHLVERATYDFKHASSSSHDNDGDDDDDHKAKHPDDQPAPISGPGNHPAHPAHPTHRDFAQDTIAALHAPPSAATDARVRTQRPSLDATPPPTTANGASPTTPQPSTRFGPEYAIELALGDSGPVGSRRGAALDRQINQGTLSPQSLVQQGKMSNTAQAAAATAATAAHPQGSSARLDSSRDSVDAAAAADSDSDDADSASSSQQGQHASSPLSARTAAPGSRRRRAKRALGIGEPPPDFRRGPLGASQPDEEQRLRVKELKRQREEEIRQQHHHAVHVHIPSHLRFARSGGRKEESTSTASEEEGGGEEGGHGEGGPVGTPRRSAKHRPWQASGAASGNTTPSPAPPSPSPAGHSLLSRLALGGANASSRPTSESVSAAAGRRRQSTPAAATLRSDGTLHPPLVFRSVFGARDTDASGEGLQTGTPGNATPVGHEENDDARVHNGGEAEPSSQTTPVSRLSRLMRRSSVASAVPRRASTTPYLRRHSSNIVSPVSAPPVPEANGDRAHATLDSGLRRAGTGAEGAAAPNRWTALKSLIQQGQVRRQKAEVRKGRIAGNANVVTELQTGILPVFMIKMALERDEANKRRIPVLLNHVRLHLTDSVNALHSTHAVFRIELEYGDGLIRWVVYRELRDFINLHAHYRAAALRGYLGRPVGASEGDVGLPSFPKTSLPYLNQLQRQGIGGGGGGGGGAGTADGTANRDAGGGTKGGADAGGAVAQRDAMRAEFTRRQREALENYLLALIRSTMFRPEANRLCKFFEVSALSLSLASRGGFQGKQGYLRILSRSSRKDAQKGLLTPRSWAKSFSPKWFVVRESYIVICEEPDELQVYDVFLMDNEFRIERPKRFYKQTMHLAQELGHGDRSASAPAAASGGNGAAREDLTALVTDGFYRSHQFEDPSEAEAFEQSKAEEERKRGKGKSAATKSRPKPRPRPSPSSADPAAAAAASSHTFYIRNAERRLKLVAKTERLMEQFIASMERVAARSIFSSRNRFGSFAPIRLHCHAQWLVDGRDYFWNVSKALLMAKDRIYIHDWWLSPELYLRRPGTPRYRLDEILRKKAGEGVKIFVIVYNEVSNNFTPTDSNYTKQTLIRLHPNIYVQRSPSHLATGTFYWAHHEKLCVIDETIAFMGGLDLCFGRWDTPDHALVDESLYELHDGKRPRTPPPQAPGFVGPTRGTINGGRTTNAADGAGGPGAGADAAASAASFIEGGRVEAEEFFIWPGQDYANERVMEWYDLSKPWQDLFDRHRFPRQPWHDVGLQLIGQPARDLCRHFCQRWNYLLRIKNHSRRMPFLIPPPDFTPAELQRYGLTGTCEVQICRSAGPWSLGTPQTVERSIQDAYLKAIQLSDHFVYIENQFFVTSTHVRGTEVTNQIGSALVDRILRAHRQGTPWRCVVVMPLLPGFPMPIHEPDASSVRLILELQYASICRGEHSIFARLRRCGVDPDEYINFFSLRSWARLPGGELTTEQIYPHDKVMIVDDRLVIIGSANINERSQRGDRDSELACVIRDTDMVPSTMDGEPYMVGRFAHSLRVRLMREHLGVDVDEIEAKEAGLATGASPPAGATGARNDVPPGATGGGGVDGSAKPAHAANGSANQPPAEDDAADPATAATLGSDAGSHVERASWSKTTQNGAATTAASVDGTDDAATTTTTTGTATAGVGAASSSSVREKASTKQERLRRRLSQRMMANNPWAPPASVPEVDPDAFEDPLDDDFYQDMWLAGAVHNTQIYRKVFKCVPDDTVNTWQDYMAFKAWSDRLAETGVVASPAQQSEEQRRREAAATEAGETARDGFDGAGTSNGEAVGHGKSGEAGEAHKPTNENGGASASANGATPRARHRRHTATSTTSGAPSGLGGAKGSSSGGGGGGVDDNATTATTTTTTTTAPAAAAPNSSSRRQPSSSAHRRQEGFTERDLQQMQALLHQTVGHLVLHPTRFLAAESAAANLLFPMDLLNPIQFLLGDDPG